ncbi:hypothetical protein [Bartonella sp. MF74HXZ]
MAKNIFSFEKRRGQGEGRGENCGFEIRGILLMELGRRWLEDVTGAKL